MSLNLFLLLLGNVLGAIALRLAQTPTQSTLVSALGTCAVLFIGQALYQYLRLTHLTERDP